MLLKAEKILTEGDRLISCSEEDIYRFVKTDLTEQIIRLAMEKGLVKTTIKYDWDEQHGNIVRVQITMRAYNPDD